jgi:nucleotide-binding universal stress UspA family protein
MFKRMLVPLDGSSLAEQLIPFAKRLAEMLNLEVIFLHVCRDNQSPSEFMCRSYINHIAENASTKIAAQGEVILGDPAQAISKYADENIIDLMLLGTHGNSGFGRWTTGSTAHKIITLSKMPVMLIPHIDDQLNPSNWPRNILLPLDGSPDSESIIPYIRALAKGNRESHLTLLKICAPPDILADYPEAIQELSWDEHVKRATAATRNTCGLYLDEVKEHFRADNVQISSEVLLGEKDDVAGEIAAFAKAHDCDLIAMSTHGRSGYSEWPFGHVTDKLVRSLSIPLFLFKPGK